MRNQLIDWMMEDILPKVRQNHKPESTLLKFASEKNLTPGLLEAMGQLYNTAKTLSYLEKAANRGSTFPIIDVPKLVGDYLEVHKKEAGKVEPVSAPEEDLPACFAGLLTPARGEVRIEDAPRWNMAKRAAQELSVDKLLFEFTEQAIFEAKEDAREVMEKIAINLRQNAAFTDFEQMESDAVFVIGEEIAPLMNKVASFMVDDGWRVKRASGPGDNRLVRDRHGFLPQLRELQDCFVRVGIAEELLKEASAVMEPPRAQGSPPKSDAPAPAGGEAGGQEEPRFGHHQHRPQGPARLRDESKGKPPEKGKDSGKPAGGAPAKPSGTYTGMLGRGMDSAVQPLLNRYVTLGEKAFSGTNNRAQQHVDKSMLDTRHLAVLQNLLTTDDVLAEADPDKVVSLYQTLRENAPQIAGDANVARVVLRSMIQHDGVSPFDLKSFLDTESAKQKVDLSNRQMDQHLYRGGQLPGSKPNM